VDRILAAKLNPGVQQQQPWTAAFLLGGARVRLHWGNVNYSESSMSHAGANGVYGKNSMLHDAMWLTSGGLGSGAMMVAQSMLWGAGLCGRPATLQQDPLIVMAAGDRAATLVRWAPHTPLYEQNGARNSREGGGGDERVQSGLQMAQGILQGVGAGDQLCLSFWVLHPMMGVDIAQEVRVWAVVSHAAEV
jgi:hypothetical protein